MAKASLDHQLDDSALGAVISRLAREIPQQQSLLAAAMREQKRRRRAKNNATPQATSLQGTPHA